MGRRFFRHGELPLVLLALLMERPLSAYDLMAELSRLFGPFYRPSPGSIYPAVEALQAEGLIRPVPHGASTTYRPTAVGRAALQKRRQTLAEFELRTGVRIASRGSTDALLSRFSAEVQALAPHVDPADIEEVLDRAATALRERADPPTPQRTTTDGDGRT